jgi:hypothetical protein
MPDQSPSKSETNNAKDNVESGDNTKADNVEIEKKTDDGTSNSSKENNDSDKFLRWATFTVDVLVFIAVAVYSVFACLQWLAIREQLTQMKESKYLSRLDQRAWVAPNLISGKPEIGQYYKIKVDIRNTGKTFARRLTGVALLKRKELSEPDPDFTAEEERGNLGNPGLLAPNAQFSYTLEMFKGDKLTQGQMDFLHSPATVILIFGKITYWDIFNCEHWTVFCYQCTPEGDCYTYGPHNDADDNRCP